MNGSLFSQHALAAKRNKVSQWGDFDAKIWKMSLLTLLKIS